MVNKQGTMSTSQKKLDAKQAEHAREELGWAGGWLYTKILGVHKEEWEEEELFARFHDRSVPTRKFGGR